MSIHPTMPLVPLVNVGPFHINHVDDQVRANTVARDRIPVVLYESRMKAVNGVEKKQEKWAVMVPPNKYLGIVCAGCYKPGMTLWNNSLCMSCRSFANHLDTIEKDPRIPEDLRTRKRPCLGDLDDCINRVGNLPSSTNTPGSDVSMISTKDLEAELKRRHDDIIFVTEKELTTEEMDKILAKIPDTEYIMALKGKHPDGLAGYLNHVDDKDIIMHLDNIDLKEIKAYVKEKEKAGRARRALKHLC